MTVLCVPYHLDELLPTTEFPADPDRVVTADLPTGTHWRRVAGLYDAVAAAVADTDRPRVLTGDCATALGVVAGLQRRGVDPSVVWFDAHGDLNTPESSTSGYPGGMCLRMLLGDGDPTVADAIGLRPIPATRVTLVGARDLDPPEADFLATSQIRRSPVATVPAPDGPIYLHIDLDVIDDTELPGLRYPSPNGPTPPTVRDAALRLLATGRVAALTLACTWHPGTPAARAARAFVAAVLD